MKECEFEFEVEGHDTKASANAGAAGKIGGFYVIRVQASPNARNVIAVGFLNGKLICSASAADQTVSGVTSSPTQSFTMPVPFGAKVQFRTNLGNPKGHVFAEYIPA